MRGRLDSDASHRPCGRRGVQNTATITHYGSINEKGSQEVAVLFRDRYAERLDKVAY
jgi:hypothetical protein